MKNITKKTQTILFASLIAAMILPFSGIDFAFAEVSPEIKEKAKQGLDVWKELKAEEKKVKKDNKKIDKLEKEFDKYVKELNKHGIATPEQWDANPQYWRSVNLPSSPTATENTRTHNSVFNMDYFSSTTDSQIELMCHGCSSSQNLQVIAGFDYLLWGWWPTSAYSIHGWKTLTYNGDSDATAVTLEDDHSEVTPHITQKIKKSGTVNYDYGYDARIYGTHIDSNSGNLQSIQVDPNSLAITMDPLDNVVENTIIKFDVDVQWGI